MVGGESYVVAGVVSLAVLHDGVDAVAEQIAGAVERGGLLGLAVSPAGVGLAVAASTAWAVETDDPLALVVAIERRVRPRWAWWNAATASWLLAEGVRIDLCWDIAAVQRMLYGGWRADPARV
ncbi:MAG TPA: hypothetical protein PLV68_08155, partial [Ilumatobacteraceae bacterium]|nr:hypothetical protein [Ilumatobacteraceae bacterium]